MPRNGSGAKCVQGESSSVPFRPPERHWRRECSAQLGRPGLGVSGGISGETKTQGSVTPREIFPVWLEVASLRGFACDPH